MNIAFYINEMNFRGVANSTYLYAINNKSILKNNSIIFYNKKNIYNKKEVILKFKRKFKVFGIKKFKDIDSFKKIKIDYIYIQKGGEKDSWVSDNIKTLVHYIYPQKLSEIHGNKYIGVSEWHSKKFSNNKIPFLEYIVQTNKTKKNLRKKFKIKTKQIVFGCHGGESSFDLKFTHDTLLEVVKKRNDVTFLFLNINKFCNHPRIIFLKGSFDEVYKKQFLNTCDAMIYGRSLGESFGMACGEFALQRKKIITYKFNRHRSHVSNIPNSYYEEYSSKSELFNIINKADKKNLSNLPKKNKYLKCSANLIMQKFNNVFLKKNIPIKISFYDNILNFIGFMEMYYYYLRHKVYINYYRFFESKF
jgi:hypothetical protein